MDPFRNDAPIRTKMPLDGLHGCWDPLRGVRLPLSEPSRRSLRLLERDLFALGNHGLIVAGESAEKWILLREVTGRSGDSAQTIPTWGCLGSTVKSPGIPHDLAGDDGMHALARHGFDLSAILAGGLLYPVSDFWGRHRSGPVSLDSVRALCGALARSFPRDGHLCDPRTRGLVNRFAIRAGRTCNDLRISLCCSAPASRRRFDILPAGDV